VNPQTGQRPRNDLDTLVQAEPVYLDCHVIDTQGHKTRINITRDEANQHVSYLIVDTGLTQKMTGVFSADRVFFVSDPGAVYDGDMEINSLME